MSYGRVVVVGSFMMDLVVSSPRRPRSGETIVGTDFGMFLGGKGFNQAVAAARCGAKTTMIGRLGADEFGDRFLDQLRRDGIDAAHVTIDPSLGTGVGAPLIDGNGENSIVIVPRANLHTSPADVERAARDIAAAQVVLLQLELPIDTTLAAARLAKDSGSTVVLNPAPAPPADLIDRLVGLVDVLVPNEVEAADLCRSGAGDGLAQARELSDRLGTAVVLTVGARGCVAVSGSATLEVPAHDVVPVDTVGAGDAFCGALGARLASGAPLVDALAFANAAGALAVTRRGAEPAMPHRHEAEELLGRAEPVAALVDALTRSEAGVADGR